MQHFRVPSSVLCVCVCPSPPPLTPPWLSHLSIESLSHHMKEQMDKNNKKNESKTIRNRTARRRWGCKDGWDHEDMQHRIAWFTFFLFSELLRYLKHNQRVMEVWAGPPKKHIALDLQSKRRKINAKTTSTSKSKGYEGAIWTTSPLWVCQIPRRGLADSPNAKCFRVIAT